MEAFEKMMREKDIEQDILALGDVRTRQNFVDAPLSDHLGQSSPDQKTVAIRTLFYDDMRIYCLSNGIDLVTQKAPTTLYMDQMGCKFYIEARTHLTDEMRMDHVPSAIARFCSLKAIEMLKESPPIAVLSLYNLEPRKLTSCCQHCDSILEKHVMNIRFGMLLKHDVEEAKKLREDRC